MAQLLHLYHYKMTTKVIYETSHQENIPQYIKINLPINKLKLKLTKSQIKDHEGKIVHNLTVTKNTIL